MFKKILLGLLVLVIGFVIVVALRPATFRVTRSTTINAAPDAVFGQVNDLRKWEAWSPWAKIDPKAKTTFEGPDAGVGAVFGWSGNNEIGAGKMTITESRPNEFVKFRLDFTRPMVGTSTAEFTFEPRGNQTAVTWTMYGENNFIAKAVGLLLDCDKMVGGNFETGLARLRSIVEESRK